MIKALVLPVTQAAAPTFNTNNVDVIQLAGVAQAITSMTTNQTGTPSAGDELTFDITDNGTARAIAWGSKFEDASNLTWPTTTVLSTKLTAKGRWNDTTSKWRIQSVTGIAAPSGSGQVSVINEYDSSAGAVALTAQAIPTSSGRTLLGLRISLIGPGGSGGSGRRGAAASVRAGGGGGGGGGALIDRLIPAAQLTGTWDLSIPAGLTGRAAITSDDTSGTGGASAVTASFTCNSVVLAQVLGGAGGAGGATGAAAGGAAGTYGPFAGSAGGGSNATGGAGNIGTASNAGGAAGGGAGAGLTTGNAVAAGGAGGVNNPNGLTGGTGGVADGAAPTSGPAAKGNTPGAGAGGGGSNTSAAGTAGADGVGYGAGGGGGSASLNGNNSGGGGKGGPGYARLEWIFG